MTDLASTLVSVFVLILGIGGCMVLRARGVATTYLRDLLHIGAGAWVLGWPLWHSPVLPIAIVVAVAVAVAIVPRAAKKSRISRSFLESVTNSDEHWTGLVVYTASFVIFTTLGLLWRPFPAAAALLALALGDGIGGLVGRRFGRISFRTPGAKRKTLEGSVGVAVAATLGALIAAQLFDPTASASTLVFLGLVAALAEAASPRRQDNLFVPVAVFVAALVIS